MIVSMLDFLKVSTANPWWGGQLSTSISTVSCSTSCLHADSSPIYCRVTTATVVSFRRCIHRFIHPLYRGSHIWWLPKLPKKAFITGKHLRNFRKSKDSVYARERKRETRTLLAQWREKQTVFTQERDHQGHCSYREREREKTFNRIRNIYLNNVYCKCHLLKI